MGFTLQGLAPPDQRCPSRGLASPVVSPRRPQAGRAAATPEVCSGREGAPRSPRERGDSETLPSWGSPLQGFLLRHLGSASRSTPLLPFRPETLPTVYSRTGLQGFECDASGWSPSRLPALLGFCTFPVHALLEPPPIPGLWFRLGVLWARVPAPLWDGRRPAGARRATASVRWVLPNTRHRSFFKEPGG
jgi:hypothetical protein